MTEQMLFYDKPILCYFEVLIFCNPIMDSDTTSAVHIFSLFHCNPVNDLITIHLWLQITNSTPTFQMPRK